LIEAGQANISILRLAEISLALDRPLHELIPAPKDDSSVRSEIWHLLSRCSQEDLQELRYWLRQRLEGQPQFVALVGLRGAGKSTIGPRLAKRLKTDFFELDSLVEKAAGISLAAVFAMHGEYYYRRLEREALRELLGSGCGGVVASFPSVLKEPDLEISNLIITGKSTSDVDFYRETRLQASDSLSRVSGGHSFKVGADFNYLRDTAEWDLFFPARVIFATLGGPGVAGPTFLNQTPVVFWWPLVNGTTTRPALPVPFTQDVPDSIRTLISTGINHNAYGFFGQDEWKATPKLTLTLGLRYDFETYPSELVAHNDFNNFQPRAGLAFAFTPHTVVRAGFGIFNDRLFTSIGQTLGASEWLSAGDLPNAQVLFPGIQPLRARFLQPTVGGALAAPTSVACRPGGPLITTASAAQFATCMFASTGAVPAAPLSGGIVYPGFRDNKDGHLRTPYSEQASLQISHELGGGFAVSVSYLYVHALKLGGHTGMLNGVKTGVLPSGKPIYARAAGGRRFPELGDFFVISSLGYSIHHGGSFELQKRFSHGFSIHSSYTFSKTINNSESVANLADLPEDPKFGPERAVSRQSVPHRFTLAFVSEIPSSVRVLHSFKFSSLLTASAGRRFNVFAGSDANGDGNPLSDRPGTLGRNTLKGPSFASFDLRIARPVHLSERVVAEFSGDFFNLFNRTNITDLNTVYGGIDLGLPPNPLLGFGTARDAANPFQVQYAVKFRF
jgi:outer membrane receptor protein involved in Fe transport